MTTIALPKPHSQTQMDMITFPGNVAAFAGRRFGKTDGFAQRIFYSMKDKPGLYWWVGLSWRSASMKRAWRLVSDISRKVLQQKGLGERHYINRSTFEVKLPGSGEIWFRTADNPSSLAGEGIRGAVVDEFSLMQEIVWTEYLEATLLDFGGWVAFAGVPKGRNWAANLWQAAGHREGWKQIHATTYDNPFIDNKAIDEIKANLSERFFQQEYLAQIVDDAGVFRNVKACVGATTQTKAKDSDYVLGVDWGKLEDFTVFTVIDAKSKEVCYVDRFNQIDYTIQVSRLKALCEKFNPHNIIAERNAMGEPIIETLQRDGYPVQPFTTTNASKQAAIDALQLAFEREEIRIPDDPVLIAELQAFEAQRLPSGMLRYSAPQGYHDDTVMSLALAWSGISDNGSLLLW